MNLWDYGKKNITEKLLNKNVLLGEKDPPDYFGAA